MSQDRVSFHTELGKACGEATRIHDCSPLVAASVESNLRELVRAGIQVRPTAMVILGFGIQQLCKAPDTEDIDWLKLAGFAADVMTLWQTDAVKAQ